MLKRMQKDTRNPTASSHTYRSGTVLDWFPEYNDYYPVSVRIPTNQILEEQIQRVTIHMVSGTMCTNNLINTVLRIHNHLIDTVIDKIKEELK